jgi:chorismate mutase
MNPALRNQLRHLDRAILALLDERARLLANVAHEDALRASAVDDMLRRHSGPLAADAVRDVFAAVDRACTPFGQAEVPR